MRCTPRRPTVRLDATRTRSAALAERGRFGIRLGLGRTRALLRELGDPQLAVRGALVAGTNGKGSVLALAGCRAAGRRPARRRDAEAPPRLVSRAAPDRRRGPSTRPTFARLVGDAIAAADRRRAAARRADRVRAPDRGRLPLVRRGAASTSRSSRSGSAGGSTRPMPGTAAWPRSRTSTSTTWTGSGRRSPHIAREKAAIIERGDLAVTGATRGRARDRPPPRAARLGVPLTIVDPAPVVALDRDGHRRGAAAPRADAGRAARPPPGGERRGRRRDPGCACAAGIADVPDAARRRGYADARWPGRLELLEVDGRDVLLDGAHNPAGAAALAAALDDLRPFLGAGPRDARHRVDGRQGRRRRRRGARRRRRRLAERTGRRDGRRRARGRCRPTSSPTVWSRRRRRPAGDGAADRRRRARYRRRPSTGCSAARRARSSWPARSISSARSGLAWSTTRSCATRCDAAAMTGRRIPPTASVAPLDHRRRRRDAVVRPAGRARRPGSRRPLRIGPRIRWGARTYVMGILNITPDSFSGDGAARRSRRSDADPAGRRPPALAGDGRRGRGPARRRRRIDAGPVTPRSAREDEIARVVPVVARPPGGAARTPLSVDTTKAAVAAAALDAGRRPRQRRLGRRRRRRRSRARRGPRRADRR